jgi:Na+-driven multidrug efflux pump
MFGLDALWWSFPISETMAALLAWVWWKHIRRQMAGQV